MNIASLFSRLNSLRVTERAGLGLVFWVSLVSAASASAAEIQWQHLTSAKGDLPVPGASTQQTGSLIADLDGDAVQDFVICFRQKPPALAWYRRTEKGWDRYVIEKDFLTVEAGGAAGDIDGDGDLDVVFGADSQNKELWWWENPAPNFDPEVSWKRRLIKNEGARQHHDQIFGDFLGTGKAQLVFWNQGAKSLFLAPIPKAPKETEPWPCTAIFSGQAGEGIENAARYAEGLAVFDIDRDGTLDLLAGNYWFKHEGANSFKPIKVGTIGGRIAAGYFKPGQYPQIVIAPGDGSGPLKIYECTGKPDNPADWSGRDLVGRDMVHGHTLDLGDINGDGHLDIFAAEMAKWSSRPQPDHPEAKAWIFYGDGRGGFETTVFTTGHGWHEGRVADLDGDGDLDILNKPYTWEAPRVDVWLNNGTGRRVPVKRTAIDEQGPKDP